MADPANDFMRDYQALARQSWDAWTRQFQQPPAANPFAPPPTQGVGNETVERTLAGLRSYFDWMQGVSGAGVAQPHAADWQQQLQQVFGGSAQPFAQAFGGIDGAGAEGFARQWQSWWQAAQRSGFGDVPAVSGATPAFGLNREQQMEQQELAAALLASMQASAKYQGLIQRANMQGMQQLQAKLAERAAPGRQVDSLKGLYDLWVDASEEAYAEIALSDEFRDAYGEMVNTQMRVRQLQQQQTEEMCRQLGVPTRSEVSSLGERLQALRRELRASQAGATTDQADEIMALRRELATVKRQLAGMQAAASEPKGAVAKKAPKVARKPVATSKSSASPRKRK